MIRSEVITSVRGWYDESLLVPHEAIRKDLERIGELFDYNYFYPITHNKINTFYKWYNEYFYQMVHHHHTVEEELYYPYIENKVKIPTKLGSDHVTLIRLMDEFKNFETILNESENANMLEERFVYFKDKFNELSNTMNEHLHEEESVIPNILKEHFTEEEDEKMVDTIIKSLGLSGNKKMLPWIVNAMYDWRGKEKTNEFLSKLPCPIRMLYNCCWY